VLTLWFCWKFVPETKGKDPDPDPDSDSFEHAGR
jgi:hypothetical protein